MKILVINCGSSSIKYQLFDMPSAVVIAKGKAEEIGTDRADLDYKPKDGAKLNFPQEIRDHNHAMELILNILTNPEIGVLKSVSEIEAVGHRVVHGGETYKSSVIIDDEVINIIKSVEELAPLHIPANLIGIEAVKNALGDNIKMVGVFDTAFHHTIPEHAYIYPIPYKLYEEHKIRKYGFHGSSHNYTALKAAEVLGIDKDKINLIVCHLGNGCSVSAVKNGESIDTTMGMSPLAGLMMGTRCGDIDPAIIFYLLDNGIYKNHQEINDVLNKQSGVLGVSEVSSDMRAISELADKDGEKSRTQLVMNIFSYKVKLFIGSYMAVLNRVDAIIFTGGVGENRYKIREKSCNNMENLGVELDFAKNKKTVLGAEGEISTLDSKTKVLVMSTDEEAFIVDETYRLVG